MAKSFYDFQEYYPYEGEIQLDGSEYKEAGMRHMKDVLKQFPMS